MTYKIALDAIADDKTRQKSAKNNQILRPYNEARISPHRNSLTTQPRIQVSASYLSNDLHSSTSINARKIFFFLRLSFPHRPWHRSVRFLTVVEKRAPKFFRVVPAACSLHHGQCQGAEDEGGTNNLRAYARQNWRKESMVRQMWRCGMRYRKYTPKVTHTRIIVIS